VSDDPRGRRRRALSAGLRATLALLVLFVLGSACAPDPSETGPLWADPGVAHLGPARGELQIVIHNRSGVVRPVSDFALRGEDWGAFRFVDESLPRTVRAHGSIELTLAVSRSAFRDSPGRYRNGEATLEFDSDRHHSSVPLRFDGDQPEAATRLGALGPLATLAGFALLFAAALLSTARGRWWAHLRACLDRQLGSTQLSRPVVAASLASSTLLIALLPFGPGLCAGRLAGVVGALELRQCRVGLGGQAMRGLPAEPGLLWLVVALILASASASALRWRAGSERAVDARARLASLPFARLLVALLVLPALAWSLAPGSGALSDWVLAQTPNIGPYLPRWGLIAQPFGAVLALGSLALTAPLSAAAAPGSQTHPEPAFSLPPILLRADALAWSAVFALVFLGGWHIPGLSMDDGSAQLQPLLVHGASVVLGALAFALKTGLVCALALGLRAAYDVRVSCETTRLRALTHGLVPLALLNLLATMMW